MKGISIDVLAMVVTGVLILLVFSLWFGGDVEARPIVIPEINPTCKNHMQCGDEPGGNLCMSINNGPVFCGCIAKDDCQTGLNCWSDNLCR